MAKKKLSFEDSVRRLDEIVKHLESGDLPLEESLAFFEEGTALVASCNAMLEEAEQKVSILRVGKDGTLTEEPFSGE
jgi:exodeoxyribonuclease VII small subunit